MRENGKAMQLAGCAEMCQDTGTWKERYLSPDRPQPAADPDRELAEGCRSGSLAAYERLYAAHGARMKSIARNILGNSSDAEDAVQETFLKIYRKVGKFQGGSAFTTWIYRILVNASYDLLRKRRRREVPADDADPVMLRLAAPPSADRLLELTLERSLRRLGERHRTVFLLYEVEGFKHREIAEILHIPEGTSKSCLFEAKKELQRLIREPGATARA